MYGVSFKVHYETIVGEDIGVIGDCDELGNWDPLQCLKLKWITGHFWVSAEPMYT